MNKKAISFVEIIISISIIALLTTIGLSYKNSFDDNKYNTKVTSDLASLNNSFLSYKQENNILPTAKSNNNYYNSDSSYSHDATGAYGVYGYVTEGLIPKKYLNYLPIDPRTNQFYAYGKTLNPKNQQFEFAGILTNDNQSSSLISGDYNGEKMVGLIREYNGPQFIYNKSTQNFPYNPTERLMTAKIGSYSGSVSIIKGTNTYTTDILSKTLNKGDTIKVNGNGFANVYFSDGSRSTLEKNSTLVLTDMDYKSDNNLLTKIKLTLNNGTIWTKATRLNPNGSEFQVSTSDATAAVRGTIFGVEKNNTQTKVIVKKGKVEVYTGHTQKYLLKNQETTISNNNINIPTNITTSITIPTITLPSNIKPIVTNITNTGITIPEIKKGYFIKIGNINKTCNYNTDKCDISGITNSTITIKLCTTIGKKNGKNINNCSKPIKIKKGLKIENKQNLISKKLNEKLKQEDGESTKVNSCNGITVGTECYELYAKADYNNCYSSVNNTGTKDNIEKFKDFFKLIKKEGGEIKPDTNFGGSYYNLWKTVCKSKGFFIDTIGTAEYIKYSLPDLGKNFAIEMRVKGADLKRDDNKTYYLFNLGNLKLDKFYSNNNLVLHNNNTSTSTSITISSLTKDKFYTVQVICENGIGTLKIAGTSLQAGPKSGICPTSGNTELYIGSSENEEHQWNGIINFVKIYKKN